VILFDPCFDSYRPAIDFAGAYARSYVLRPPQWQIDAHQLELLITPRTRNHRRIVHQARFDCRLR